MGLINTCLKSHLYGEKQKLAANISLSIFAKGITLLVNFVSLPILVNYLGNTMYGVWLTIFSIISWMSFFDLGLGNGLRNYLTLLNSDTKSQKEFISTAYWYLSFFVFTVVLIIQITINFIDFTSLFSLPRIYRSTIHTSLSICLWGSAFLLISRLITSILQAQKKVGVGEFIIAIGNILSLLAVYLFYSAGTLGNKLSYVSFSYSFIVPFTLLVFSIYYFRKNRYLMPNIKFIRKDKAYKVFSLGTSFFLAQFFVLILNQSSSFIITSILSPQDVAIYYVPLRLFSIVSIFFGLLSYTLLPYYTQALADKNMDLVKSILKKNYLILFISFPFILLLLFFSESIISIWTNQKISVPFLLVFFHMLLAIIGCLSSIHSTFLNGINFINRQLPILAIATTLYVPLSIYLGKKFGLNGIIIATIIAQAIILFFLIYFSCKIIKKQFDE